MIPSPHTRTAAAALGVLALLPVLAAPSSAQELPGPPLPGWILVDDMWLPPEAVHGEGFYNGTPWPTGNVPFAFHGSVTTQQQNAALAAMAYLEAVCGVDFYPRTAETNFVHIRQYSAMTGGQSPVGMVGGAQELAISPAFTNPIGFVHELMHALSFRHEQSRGDRDNYVIVNTQNIASVCGNTGNQSCAGNFDIIAGPTHGPYDFLSVMHYTRSTFAIPGTDTLTCQPAYASFQTLMGMGQNMSYGDANALISLYGPTTRFPLVSGICPGVVPENALNPRIVIYGTNFYPGSQDGGGVLGSQVLVNGVAISSLNVTFIDENRLEAVIPSFWFVNQGTLQIRVDHPFGGSSPPTPLVVGPAVSYLGNWFGTNVGSHMGSAVVGLGDTNGDGFGDVVVGSQGELSSSGGNWGGLVTCYSGQDGSTLWDFLGVAPRGHGTSLANAGDIDGDGIDDLFDGAPATFGTAPSSGRAMIRSGANGNLIRIYSTGVVNDGFGTSVANAGDVNGDGIPDQIVGIPLANQAKVYSGANGTLIRTFLGSAGTYFGGAVAGGVDMNLDGVPDLAVGAPWYSSFRGRIVVYSGSTGGVLSSITGPAAGDRYGHALAMFPSPDNRPGGALYAGCPGTFTDTGQVRVYGASATTPYPLVAVRSGQSQNDHFGWSVAPAGDVDQDGRMDCVIGAPEESPDPGYIRLVSASGEIFREVHGSEPFAQFGWSVGYAGDTNRDAIPDVIIGAANTGGSCINSGSAHLLKDIRPPKRAKVMITEVFWGEPQGIEITNFAAGPVSLQGMRVIWDDGVRRVSPAIGAVTILAGESILVRECASIAAPGCSVGTYSEAPPATRQLLILPSVTTQQQALSVGLLTAGGVVLDEVRFAAVGMTSNILKGTGGHFRGAGARLTGSVSAERIWGLDSNGGGDWTSETVRSFGLENRSSGMRGNDPLPIEEIVINELLDQETAYSDNYVELKNTTFYTVDLQNWFLLWSPGQNIPHELLEPWPSTEFELDGGAFTVIGDIQGQEPGEMPASVTYTFVATDNPYGGFPAGTEEFSLGLYDSHGRCVDLVRGTGHDDQRVHNHPRAPSAWDDFGGAVRRSLDSGSGAVGRDAASTDTDSGADFRPMYFRTMGSANASPNWGGPPGHGHPLDVRLNETGLGNGLTVIINAGASHSGKRWSFLFSPGHLNGTGIFFGLGADALANWLAISNVPPWSGFLDGRGSARLDVAPNTVPAGLQTDDIFIIQDSGGGLDLRTLVIEWDT